MYRTVFKSVIVGFSFSPSCLTVRFTDWFHAREEPDIESWKRYVSMVRDTHKSGKNKTKTLKQKGRREIKNGASVAELATLGWKIVQFRSLSFLYFHLYLYLISYLKGLSRFCFWLYWSCSRPKQVKDVAHQDEVVRVLTNTLETTNVLSSLFQFELSLYI